MALLGAERWALHVWTQACAPTHRMMGLTLGLCARAADRYFGSFPKVGVVVPAAAAWVLPELQDMARTLTTTLDLPFELVHGISAEPTSDGFLIYLPSSAAPAAALGRPC
jgi:hypothetical protein